MGSRSVPDAVVVCAEVLGRFGVAAETVSRTGDSPEAAIEAALDRAPSRAEFLGRTISTAPRGIDAPARYARETPWTALRTTFEALGWSFAVEDRSGRPVDNVATPAGPFSVTVEDGAGRTRTATVEYPSTPLGRYNLPAVLAQVERGVLYGLDWEFVALSDGTDRWRFAPVRTEDLATLREAHGDRIAPFDRSVLARDGPAAYEPPADSSVWPAWTDEGDAAPSTRGATVSASPSSPPDSPDDVIRFVGGDDDPADAEAPDETTGRTMGDASATTPDGETDADDGDDADDGETVAGVTFDSLSGWSTADDGPDRDAAASDFTLSGSPTTVRTGADAVGRDDERDDETEPDSGTDRTGEGSDTGDPDDDFFDGGLSGGPSVDRVETESFGLPESQTEDERLQAAGAAIDAGGGVSVSGLLDDESFLPTIPAEGPTEVTMTFEDSFDPSAPSPADTRESDSEDGFVWVNADGLE